MPENNLTTSVINHPWGHGRPFNAYSNYLKSKFGSRVQKVSLHVGFTCPNHDGTVAVGGCTYCNNRSFTPSYCNPNLPITDQLQMGLQFLKKRYRNTKHFVAYFQSYTNTYAPIAHLKKLYDEALNHTDISGLIISTRPDCINEPILELLANYAEKHFVVLEFGIESCYNDTLAKINRGHTFEQTQQAIKLAASYGHFVGGHLLFGLPGDDNQRMLNSAELVSELPLSSIKFHHLQIIRGTAMAVQYNRNPASFELFTLEKYKQFVINFVERLRPNLLVQRFAAEAPPKLKIAPDWGHVRSEAVSRQIEEQMLANGNYQGRLYHQGGKKASL